MPVTVLSPAAMRADFSDAVVTFVAGQVAVPASDLGFYEWAGRTI